MGASFLIAYVAIACALRVASASDPCECNAYGCVEVFGHNVCYVTGGLSCERARPSRFFRGKAYIPCPGRHDDAREQDNGEPVYETQRTCSKAYVLNLEDARIPYKIIAEPEHSPLPMKRCTSKTRQYVENYGYDAANIQSIATAAASAESMAIADGVEFQDEAIVDGELVKSKSSSESSVITYADEKWYVSPRNCKPYVEVCDPCSRHTYDEGGNEIGCAVPGEIAGHGTCDYEFTSLKPCCKETQVCIKNCPEEPAPPVEDKPTPPAACPEDPTKVTKEVGPCQKQEVRDDPEPPKEDDGSRCLLFEGCTTGPPTAGAQADASASASGGAQAIAGASASAGGAQATAGASASAGGAQATAGASASGGDTIPWYSSIGK